MAQRKGTWGGKRPGAGRPPTLEDSVMLNVRMTRSDVEQLRRTGKEKGLDLSTHVRAILKRSLERSRRQRR